MPNHITNILKFEGDSEQVHALLDQIKNEELGIGSIDFNKIIPMPESLNIEAGSRTDDALYVCMMALNPAAPDMGVPKLSSEEYQKLAGIVGRSKGEQFMTLDAQRIFRCHCHWAGRDLQLPAIWLRRLVRMVQSELGNKVECL